MTRTWGHAEDKDSRLPYSWVSDHEIEPDAVDGTCTGCGGRIALVWTETWDCGCIFAVAEGALVRPCPTHAAEDATTAAADARPIARPDDEELED